MTNELVLTNARVVLPDEVIHGTVVVRDGQIADVSSGNAAAGENLDGDYLLPGVVELHTDHAEYHLRPRPGVDWDAMPAVLAHDAQMATAGATTVLDAVRLGSEPGDRETVTRSARRLADAITTAARAGALRADHAIHLRCEVSAEDCLDRFEEFADNPRVRLASLMDHTPGQRQFEDVGEFKRYYIGKGIVSESNIDGYVDVLLGEAKLHSDRNRRAVAEAARRRGIALAAHDDATVEHIQESVSLGVRIAEFPTTVVAAASAGAHGLSVIMGAPNIVRGGSQSGNVAASALLDRGLLHILSSDYVPSSPMQAVFQLVTDGTISIQNAVKLISTNPANAVGMTDRGEIVIGKRGDLLRVRPYGQPGTPEHPTGLTVPIVRAVYRQGGRVA
ncbi:alpha-D-ribose 1-methylphosphonate 5-triphosphate diphosphatase [Arthrobacter sp. M4]|uniref:alpha-D-ribose 1-methylphosphonate 5-triphosphate diphosphatase n=1 Tax=Arthrobacter sp. M4 TaxID=218160 RepID=UPI001CDBC2F6|nr:alpha-D-ribose 1-methylphosphonate 5-triphosphate diphosphatase [Arthrobacter sp. M4]MCA4132578.1 alpha-D-ribose 1-methylphosphonate 5-triphosphate diphosphatase [Arthrobacter sp. M4]